MHGLCWLVRQREVITLELIGFSLFLSIQPGVGTIKQAADAEKTWLPAEESLKVAFGPLTLPLGSSGCPCRSTSLQQLQSIRYVMASVYAGLLPH